MTIQTFSPPRPPSLGSKKNIVYAIKEANFGEGHVQRAADGINNKRVSWELTWNGLTVAEADTIEAFFDARGGYQAFYYTVAGDIQRKYRCKNPMRLQAEGQADRITVTFEQVFDQ